MAGKPTILLLEDEMLIGLALADALERHDYALSGPYVSAEDALDSLDDNPPDAAFLDINLGGGRTSFGLALHLRERGIPFTFLTGYSEFSPDDDRLADAHFLPKPLDADRAVSEAQRMLDRVQ